MIIVIAVHLSRSGIIKSLTVELSKLETELEEAKQNYAGAVRMKEEASRMLSDWAQKDAEVWLTVTLELA